MTTHQQQQKRRTFGFKVIGGKPVPVPEQIEAAALLLANEGQDTTATMGRAGNHDHRAPTRRGPD
jgi:hypothetical protein